MRAMAMRAMIVRLAVASLVLVGSATLAYAQTSTYPPPSTYAQPSEIRGTVQRVDVATGTVYFTDGRAVRLDPNTRLYVGNREVRLADVQPGWVFVSSTSAVTPGTVVVQSSAPPAAATSGASAVAPATQRIDATGVVATVDQSTGTITLQDGRVVRTIPGTTTVWQPVAAGALVPGAPVFVRNAQALDFRPAAVPGSPAVTTQGTRSFQMGTVSNVDAANARVVLSDGTVVHLRPGARMMFNGQSITTSDLRPGDEIVVGVPASSAAAATSSGAAVSALPRQSLGVIEGEYLYVVRRPQAP